MSDLDTRIDQEPVLPPAGRRPYVRRAWGYYLLWLISILALSLNLILLIGMYNFRKQAREEVANASELLNTVEIQNFDLPIYVNETLPISLTVPFSDTFVVPISETVVVSTSIPFEDNIVVPINTVIPVNTRVSVPVPALGNIQIPIPIVTAIPVSMTVDVPISRSIPVHLNIPVDLLVQIPVESNVPIRANVPVVMDFPVTVPFEEMGFHALLQQVQDALDVLAELLGAEPQAPSQPVSEPAVE